jgi:hypothetical protein
MPVRITFSFFSKKQAPTYNDRIKRPVTRRYLEFVFLPILICRTKFLSDLAFCLPNFYLQVNGLFAQKMAPANRSGLSFHHDIWLQALILYSFPERKLICGTALF